MIFEKITEEELEHVGVTTLEDTPGLSADDMKKKFEETARMLLAPKFNSLVEALAQEACAEVLGAAVPEGLPEDTGKNVQSVLSALLAYIKTHEADEENPHNIRGAIDDKMIAMGKGDMAMAVYDKTKSGVVDDAEKLGGELPSAYLKADTYDPTGKCRDVFAEIQALDTKTENADAALNARVSAIIASGTATEGNTELIDIRTGSDGKVYPTAGDAVREQVGGLKGDYHIVGKLLMDDYIKSL